MRELGAAAILACLLGVVAGAAGAGAFSPVREDASARFELRVRPLLQRRCVSCHGPTVSQSGLRLDTAAGLKVGGRRGPAVIPGDPGSSRLFRAVSGREPNLKMPPEGALSPQERADLEGWIRAGAIWPETTGGPPRLKGDAARSHWSFLPMRSVRPPATRRSGWARNPVDQFILSRLEREKWEPAPAAGRRELLRRVTFDLTGLPPTPEEVQVFLTDGRPDAYERVVDRLLTSPRYGERWARYWLDLVRYADTNGYERDGEKPHSWKYRDYVIRSLNEDKRYDRFILEQLAGDELPDRSEETVTGTGFLRLGTWDDEPNDPLEYQYERLDDLVHATTATFLALTVRCARCHDHKYDPVPQKDYYALGAAFWPGYLRPGDGKLMGGPPEARLGYPVLGFTDEGSRPPTLYLLEKGDPRRKGAEVGPGTLTCLTDLPEPTAVTAPSAQTSGRRLKLARWIASPRHPLTARVLVNRIWQHHFGEGLVRTASNFGAKGETPTHPELLDWLASRFVAEAPQGLGWRWKALHRLLVTSSTYRMASLHPQAGEYERRDAANRWLWRFPRRRLDADALRDTLLAVSGELSLEVGGRGFVPRVEREALEGLSRKGAEWNPSPPAQQYRRTIYMFLKRALIMPFLTTFDFGDTTQPLERRESTLVAPQALALLNNPFLLDRASAFAARLERAAPGNRSEQVARAFHLAFGRAPAPAEQKRSLELLQHLEAVRQAAPPAAPTPRLRSPEQLPGLSLWLRADRGIRRDEQGRVAGWGDARGGEPRALQSSPAARPTLLSGEGGSPARVEFDGAARWLPLGPGLIQSSAFTVVAVVSDRGQSGHREILSNWSRNGNSVTSVFLGTTGAGQVRFSDAFAPAGTLSQPERLHVVTGVTSPEGTTVFQNQQLLAEKAGGLPDRNLGGEYVLGQQGNIQGEYWNGEIAEVLVFQRPLAAEERERLWGYLSDRYGITASLPSPPRVSPALRAFCQALFNSNEFLFVD